MEKVYIRKDDREINVSVNATAVMDKGVNFISKPFSKEDIACKIQNVLKETRSMDQRITTKK